MSNKPQVFSADCPECFTKLRFHKPLKMDQLVVCYECEETLEVISLEPLKLNWADEDPWLYESYDDHHTNIDVEY